MARSRPRRNTILLLVAAAIVVLPLLAPQLRTAEFSGADGKVHALIEIIDPDYHPWAAPLWTPPGREVEGLLFALQAAAGAGLLGYYLGLRRGQRQAGRATATDDPGDERD